MALENLAHLRCYEASHLGGAMLVPQAEGENMNRFLVAIGTALVVAGLLWPWLKKLHLFHLPGDIVIDRPGFKFFLPITTMLIVSAVLSLIAWLMRR
jgi:hypothetical protein